MTTRLGDRVRAEMERSGINSKMVVSRVHDHLTASIGNDADELETVTGKYSKLLNNKPEGVTYFFAPKHPARREALAKALDVTIEALEEWRAHDGARTLVLDPRLPTDAVQFIRKQADDPAAMYRVVVAPESSDVDLAIRSELAKHPAPIAVVATSNTLRMFSFAGHDVTQVRAVPRGYVLEAFQDLVAIPPPSPPPLFDDARNPLLPLHEPVSYAEAATLGHRHVGIYRRVIAPALERGDVPCLSLEDAVAWNTRDAGPLVPCGYGEREPVEVVPSSSFKLEHVLGENTRTRVWVDAGRIFAVGRHKASLAAIFAPHHDVHEPDDVAALRTRILEGHPWQLLEDATNPDDVLHRWLPELRTWVEQRQKACIKELNPGPTATARVLRDDEPAPRQWLLQLAGYGVEPQYGSLLLAFGRAADAPLITYETPQIDNERLAVLADLGGGHLLHIRALRLLGRRTHLKLRSERENSHRYKELGPHDIFDGGDVLVSVRWSNEVFLEGWALPARRTRAEQMAAYDDSDDD